jgi:ADP-heptose:LPS heptosyltransferase
MTPAIERSPKDSPTVVLFEVGALGDSIMTLPAMAALRAALPHARVLRVHSATVAEFFSGCPYADVLHAYDKSAHKLRRSLELFWALRSFAADILVNLHTPDFDRPLRLYLRDSIFLRAVGATERGGYYHSVDRFLLTHGVSRQEFGAQRLDREISRLLQPWLARTAGRAAPASEPPAYWLTDSERAQAATLLHAVAPQLADSPGFFCVSPFARNPLCEWPADRVGPASQQIAATTGLLPVFLGAPTDAPKMMAVASLLPPHSINLVGKTSIKDAAAILERSRVTVAVDSGLMHLAALMGSPAVGIFGPGNPRRWRPMGRGDFLAVSSQGECGPCFRRSCADRRCIDGVTVAAVVEAACSLIS